MVRLSGKNVVITAGPTYEAIDPVRFIGNHSTGKMGIHIAEEAARQGANVTLICGPSGIPSSMSVRRINVVSAQQMYDAVIPCFMDADIAILSAAVADYRPKHAAAQKIKKHDAELSIELEPTQDILAALGLLKRPEQFLVGFALETENAIENATSKLQRKNCDIIVLNSLADKGAGFGFDTNRISILDKQGNVATFGLKSKREVAVDIIDHIKERL
jgi:phosphopantothenoylcysteine decarboxylase/phosphopantothenate--cysteine ligase